MTVFAALRSIVLILWVCSMLDTLTRFGAADVALSILLNDTYPSLGYMVSEGATTLWEAWEGGRTEQHSSWNHIMFGGKSPELRPLPTSRQRFFWYPVYCVCANGSTKRAGPSPVNVVVRETIMERQVHFQSSD